MRILDHTHVMHIACKWSNYPSNPFFTGFYLENRLPVAIRKAAKNLQRNFLEPNSIPLSHYFCRVCETWFTISTFCIFFVGLFYSVESSNINPVLYDLVWDFSYWCLLLHFYTKRSIDDDRRITKRSYGSYAIFFGQRQQDAPIKRQKTYLKNLGKMLTILPFSYLYNLFKKTRKIVVKLLLNFRWSLSKYPKRSDAYWISFTNFDKSAKRP